MKKTTLERFCSYVHLPKKPDGCWEWLGARQFGYGVFKIHPRSVKAHRFAYETFIGAIPEGTQLDHFKCDNRGCVNPEHVRPVTTREHVLRTEGTFGSENTAKTHCPAGHEYSKYNTYYHQGRRHCRECNRARCLKHYYAKRRKVKRTT